MRQRVAAVALLALGLSGCFIFDNPYDIPPSASFRLVVTSAGHGGTYVWDPSAGAGGAYVLPGSTTWYIYFDPADAKWHLSSGPDALSGAIAASSVMTGRALPPPFGSSWLPPAAISTIDESAAGIWPNGYPDGEAGTTSSLQVHHAKGSPADTAAFQWQSAAQPSGPWSDIAGETGDTLLLQGGYGNQYVRAVVTPKDETGIEAGTPAPSPPVLVGGM